MNNLQFPVDLARPDYGFRPCPFWSWNDKLEPEELRRQVREMHAAGLGGFFMHARGGLKTRYLSDEWMACVRATLDEAGKLGMRGWLYDENGWPSGFGGGLVNGMGVAYQQKYLVGKWIDAKDAKAEEHTIAFYAADGMTRFRDGVPAGYSGPVLHCFYELNPYYVDNLDAKVVARFIEVTHEHYYRELPPELLKHLRGIFTDEPQLSRRGLLWSFVLEEEYRIAYGRELLDELPLLFIDHEDAPAVRVRFWSLVARLFSRNFMRQIYDWCEAHGWELTGHHVLEEFYSWQTASNGSVMTQYQYYHIPGMDHLSREEPYVVAMMQVASVAAQCGHAQVMSEAFALTGWNFNFYGMKWMHQIQMAHGINFLCQHLESYSLKGMRKRDYPGSWFFHQPWWEDYAKINDYFSRVGMLLSVGRLSADVLVMHGISSGWTLYRGDDNDKFMNLYSDSLRLLSEHLDGYRVAYHYGDEQLMAELGAAENSTIRIGLQKYFLVVLPQLTNLSRTVFEMFRKFKSAGGRIIGVRNQIEPGRQMIDGVPVTQEEAAWFAALEWVDNEASAAHLAAAAVPRLVITEDGQEALQLIGCHRDFDDLEGRRGRLYYVVNRRYNWGAKAHLVFPEGGHLEVIDPDTGAFRPVAAGSNGAGRIELDYEFPPAGAMLFFVSEARAAADMPEIEPVPARNREPLRCLADAAWQCTLAGDNFLTLDRCDFRVDGGAWETNDVRVIHDRLLRLERPCELEMRFHFDCAEGFDYDTSLKLVVETPEAMTFQFNGVPFEAKDTGFVFDSAFRVVPLPRPRPGRNEILIRMAYRQDPEIYAKLRRAAACETEYNMMFYDTEVECVYLAGNFGVANNGRRTQVTRKSCWNNGISCGTGVYTEAERWYGDFALTAPVKEVDPADLLRAGLPFWAGTLTLSREVELSAAEVKGIRQLRFTPAGVNSVKVRINGADAGACFWPPFEIAVGDLLRPGKNRIELELTQSLRNLLGPFHLKEEGESGSVYTLSFNKEPNAIDWPAPPYDEGYCLVKLGVAKIELA